jgi:hypothetical protein|tara:strand:- start:3194 stop:3388 length:195 start_codon:yes stop_codon:yes gene_type:complete
MFSNLQNSAVNGSWIKDQYRGDRSLGFVISIDETTNMMLVRFPKVRKDSWLVWRNHGHYVVIGD